MSILDDRDVALVRDSAVYPRNAPYHPSEAYPEFHDVPRGSEDNPAFRAVRNVLFELKLDNGRFGTAEWNPLQSLVRPGHTVVLKPNMVCHRNLGERTLGLTDTDSLVTHGSVIRVVAEYTAKALKGRGRIVVGDSPIQDTDWNTLLDLLGLPSIRQYFARAYPSIDFELRDYRIAKAVVNRYGVISDRVESETTGFTEVDLGDRSLLLPLMQGDFEFGVARYPRRRMRRAHTPAHNYYLIPREVLEADAVINLPKLKTHMKAAISGALKNFVGINGHKDYLPHFRFGSPKDGGDEYPDGGWFWDLMWRARHREWEIERGKAKLLWFATGWGMKQLLPLLGGVSRSHVSFGGGGWHGNDTLWRTVLDITSAFFYYDRGRMVMGSDITSSPAYLVIVDGLVGGHKESPLMPSPVASGVMLGGFNPVAVDTVATAVMGFDLERVAQLKNAYGSLPLPLVRFKSSDVRIQGIPGVESVRDIERSGSFPAFEPSAGYRGHLERSRPAGFGAAEASDVDRE